jgi:hypothetical protein
VVNLLEEHKQVMIELKEMMRSTQQTTMKITNKQAQIEAKVLQINKKLSFALQPFIVRSCNTEEDLLNLEKMANVKARVEVSNLLQTLAETGQKAVGCLMTKELQSHFTKKEIKLFIPTLWFCLMSGYADKQKLSWKTIDDKCGELFHKAKSQVKDTKAMRWKSKPKSTSNIKQETVSSPTASQQLSESLPAKETDR